MLLSQSTPPPPPPYYYPPPATPSVPLSLDLALVFTIILAIVGAATQLMRKFEQVSTAITRLEMKVVEIETDVKQLTTRHRHYDEH